MELACLEAEQESKQFEDFSPAICNMGSLHRYGTVQYIYTYDMRSMWNNSES